MDWWRYNKLNLLLSFLIVVMLGCNSKVTKRYEIEGLTIGLNHYEVFKLDKKDSLEFLPPPPPPFEGNMSNVNVFEAKNGFVYFYVFKTKESVCGYASENEKYKFEVYNPELKAMEEEDIKSLTDKNIDSFIYNTLNTGSQISKPMFSIGIQTETSTNYLLKQLVNQLYQNSYNNIWKVRPVNEKENLLVSKID